MRERRLGAIIPAMVFCVILAIPMLAAKGTPIDIIGLQPTDVMNTSSIRYPTWDGEPLFTLHICVSEESPIPVQVGNAISESLRDIGIEGVVHEVPFYSLLLGLYPDSHGMDQYGFERPCPPGPPELVTIEELPEIAVMQGYDIAFFALGFPGSYDCWLGFLQAYSSDLYNQGYSNAAYDALLDELVALPIDWDANYPDSPDLSSPDGTRALELLYELQTTWNEEQPALVLHNRMLWGEDNGGTGFAIAPLNLANEHLAKPEVRRAISLAMNRQAILDIYQYESPWDAYLVDTWIPPWHPAFGSVSYAEYDIMQARQILFDAGYYNIIAVAPQRDYGYSIIEVFNDLGMSDGFAVAGASMNNYGDFDYLLVRIGNDGTELWRKTYDFGDHESNVAFDIVQCSDGGFALIGQGNTGYSDALLVKTDSDGVLQWSVHIDNNGQNDMGYALIELSDGGFAIAASTSDGPGSSGNWDGWLVITDAMGVIDEDRSQIFGGPNAEFVLDIIACPDGGFALTGYSQDYTTWNADLWLLRVYEDGSWWDVTYGEVGSDYGTSLIMTDDGGFAIGGMTYNYGANGLDAWIVKTDAMGIYQWSEIYGGDGYEQGTTIIKCEGGGYALGASTYSYDTNSYDFWLLQFSDGWDVIGSGTYGTTGYDMFQSMVQTDDHVFAMAGWTGMGDTEILVVLVPTSTIGIRDYVLSLPDEAFCKNPDQRGNALANKLDGVNALIDGGFYQEAIDKLLYDIRPKVDGLPNPDDWVIDAAAQEELCYMIDALIAYLSTLI